MMDDLRRNRQSSPVSKRILQHAREEQDELREDALNKTANGDVRGEAQTKSDIAYFRAKTEVMVNAEEHRFRMTQNKLKKVKSIVSYHWSPKKRRQMQKRVNKITEPIENQTLDEIWESISQRKEGKGDMSNILDKMNISHSYQ